MNASSNFDKAATLLKAVPSSLWPLIALLAIVIFQRPLRDFLSRATEIKYKDFDIKAEMATADAASKAKAVATTDSLAQTSPPALTHSGASEKPGQAVLNAWAVVEDAIAGQARNGLSLSVPEATSTLGLPPVLTDVASQLSAVRGTASKNLNAISPATATNFVAAAHYLYQAIVAKRQRVRGPVAVSGSLGAR